MVLSSRRELARGKIDLELKLEAPTVSQNVLPEKLSITRAYQNGQEGRSSVILGLESRIEPTIYPVGISRASEILKPVDPQFFSYNIVAESTLKGLEKIGSNVGSYLPLTSSARNPSGRTLESPHFKNLANDPFTQFFYRPDTQTFYDSSAQEPAQIRSIDNNIIYALSTSSRAELPREIPGAKNSAKNKKTRRKFRGKKKPPQENIFKYKTLHDRSHDTKRNIIEVGKENSDENFNKSLLKGKELLEDNSSHSKFNSREKIKIGAPESNSSKQNLNNSAADAGLSLDILAYPYQNVLNLNQEKLFYLESLLKKVNKTKRISGMSREQAIYRGVNFLSEKFKEYEEYFENLKDKWIQEWREIYKIEETPNGIITTANRIAYYFQFATVYTCQRLGLFHEQNNLKLFANNEVAKEDAIKILKDCWGSLPVAENITVWGRLKHKREEKFINGKRIILDQKIINLFDYILSQFLNISQTLCFSSNVLKYVLQTLLPKRYHLALKIDDESKTAVNFGLIRRLNNISLGAEMIHQK
ncbi:hypothetical protein BY996DRAFT_3739127 [Phakopsora pachyrhizi]|nr:hypothetical protein BY996DRAFT_3739127 [Phakopsora pachyrhizi]